jgi:MFS transporter, DHA2 family, methylenomycin A resistance protein
MLRPAPKRSGGGGRYDGCMDTVKQTPTGAAARPGLVLLAASLGVLIAQIDTSVVSLAVKRIGADLGSTVSGMQWMMDAYNVVYAALLLTGGALGDLYGRRRIFVVGVVLFALGSIACAAAPNTAVLLAGRAVSGLGAALELPMTLVLLAVAYPDSNARQNAMGIWAACNGLAFIVGPTVGGLLVDTVGWRSIFYLILPLCAAALALARSSVPESASPEGRKLDLPGQAAAIAALGGLSFVAIEGAHLGWTSAPVLAAAAIVAVAAVTFAFLERGNPHGLVPFEVFRSRPFSAALAIAGLMTFGMYALLFLMPLYFQTLLGDSPLMAGVRLLPLSVVFVAVSRWNGRIVERIGIRASMAAGMAAMGAGELVLAFVPRDAGPWLVPAALGIVGVGLGLNTAPVNSVAVANVARERSGTASGLLNTARIVGATLGIAILGAVFAHFAGQSGAAATFLEGLRPALGVGAAAELVGAGVAIAFITRQSGHAPA